MGQFSIFGTALQYRRLLKQNRDDEFSLCEEQKIEGFERKRKLRESITTVKSI